MLNKFMNVFSKYPGPILAIGIIISGAGIYSLVYTSFHKNEVQETTAVQNQQENKPYTSPFANQNIISNEEVIEQTKKCEDAGLDGQQWGHFSENDDPKGITEIRCIPRTHKE